MSDAAQILGAAGSMVLLAGGAALLVAGAEAFAANIAGLAARLGVGILAVTVLLAGAEPEEAVTASIASSQGHPALAAGTAIGSNLVILTLVLGLAASIGAVHIDRQVREYAVGAAALGAVAWLFVSNGVVSRLEGAMLLLLFAAGVAAVWRCDRRPPMIGEQLGLADAQRARRTTPDHDDAATGRGILRLFLGLLGLVAGGALAVGGAEGVVGALGLQDSVVGLTVLALATSAETLALVWSARRHAIDELVVAGIVGAVAYNAGVTLGLAAVISPLVLGRHNQAITVAVATAVLPLVLLIGPRGRLPRTLGPPLVVAYAVAVGWLLTR